MTGVAAMGVQNSLSILEKRGYIAVGTASTGGRTKLARLTAQGREAQDVYRHLTVEVERDWQARFSERTVHAARESLEALTDAGTAKESALFGGLEPYPDGWRSQRPKPDTLPHYPMVSHGLPNANLRELPGQSHGVAPSAIVPVLAEFVTDRAPLADLSRP